MKKIIFVWMMMCTEVWASNIIRCRCNVQATENLLKAIKKDDYEQAHQAIVEGADVHAVNKEGVTLLHFAARFNAVNVANLLISKGVSVNVVDGDGLTPLHYAAHYNADNLVKLLIEQRAGINAANKDGWIPLQCAADADAVDAAKWLIVAGADLNIVDGDGLNLLHRAAQRNAVNVLQVLIDKGANVDAVDGNGLTPLHFAARDKTVNAVNAAEVLIANKANIRAVSNSGYTVLRYAIENNLVDITKLLIEEGLEIPDKLNDDKIAWLDRVIIEINEERKTKAKELQALAAIVHEIKRKTEIVIKGAQLLGVRVRADGSLEELPSASTVYAQRAAAKPLWDRFISYFKN